MTFLKSAFIAALGLALAGPALAQEPSASNGEFSYVSARGDTIKSDFQNANLSTTCPSSAQSIYEFSKNLRNNLQTQIKNSGCSLLFSALYNDKPFRQMAYDTKSGSGKYTITESLLFNVERRCGKSTTPIEIELVIKKIGESCQSQTLSDGFVFGKAGTNCGLTAYLTEQKSQIWEMFEAKFQ